MAIKNTDEKTVAKKAIINSLKIEESLANLLKTEARILKRKTNAEFNSDEIAKINRTIKYVICYLIIIDDRIQKCLDIIQNNKDC
jgi:hypothetical protein